MELHPAQAPAQWAGDWAVNRVFVALVILQLVCLTIVAYRIMRRK